jgi:hypothetical protein
MTNLFFYVYVYVSMMRLGNQLLLLSNMHHVLILLDVSVQTTFICLNDFWEMGTYPVHMDLPCTYHAHELTKFIKKSEKKFTHVLSILLHLCIKFQG